ncbi:unnamed protein product [Mytilus edulis]|uniref:Uncharacterized protein n=1 Tax=Mytilus edulis TaxID=6550 RepID=A0A8S3U1N1_MYTED|nr:unnamed protein product [Mytilus edulis]
MPDHVLRDIKTACVSFVWNNGAHLVKYNTIIDQKCNGGLQLPDIESKMYAFRLKFVARFLDKNYKVLWKSTFKYFISNLSEEILFMSLPENLKCIPNVYKEMFKGFDLLRDDIEFDLSTENVYDQPLFCNPNVLFDGKTVIWLLLQRKLTEIEGHRLNIEIERLTIEKRRLEIVENKLAFSVA